MDIDKFTFTEIISYCDIDTKYVLRVICKYLNNIKISQPHLFLYRKAFKGACYGSMRMVKYKYVDKKQNIYEDVISIPYQNIIKYAKEKKINILDLGLDCACSGGNIEVINYMISKGANNRHRGFQGACHVNRRLRRRSHFRKALEPFESVRVFGLLKSPKTVT
jgi:hypothetical protein